MRYLSLILAFAAVSIASPRIQFEQNRGQTDARVRYLARTPQGTVFFTDSSIVFSRAEAAPVTFELQGGKRAAEWQPSEPTGDLISYRVGRHPRHLADNLPEYARLLRHQVYPAIDAAYYGNARQIEYDFLVAPGAD